MSWFFVFYGAVRSIPVFSCNWGIFARGWFGILIFISYIFVVLGINEFFKKLIVQKIAANHHAVAAILRDRSGAKTYWSLTAIRLLKKIVICLTVSR